VRSTELLARLNGVSERWRGRVPSRVQSSAARCKAGLYVILDSLERPEPCPLPAQQPCRTPIAGRLPEVVATTSSDPAVVFDLGDRSYARTCRTSGDPWIAGSTAGPTST
jgi:hypothetical protein